MRRRAHMGDARAGKLFYAVILRDRECDLGNIGIDGQRVHSITYQDIGALVSDHPRVSSIKLLRKNLAPYYRVLREASTRFTTVPARFGQIARDAGEVSLGLRGNYLEIRREVARLDGKMEMGLEVWWNVDDPFQFLLDQDAELRARRNQLLAENRMVGRLTEIDFGRYVYERLNRARKQITDRVLAALPDCEVRLEQLWDDKMVTNAALLISKGLKPELERAIGGLAEKLARTYSLKLNGPFPPFSFVHHLELTLSHV